MVSTTQVLSFPPSTTAERDALPPVLNGTMIYNSTINEVEFTLDNGSTWNSLSWFDYVTLQIAYDNGNVINLAPFTNFTINDAALDPVLSVSDNNTDAFKPLNVIIDGVNGPVITLQNTDNGLNGNGAGLILSQSKSDIGTQRNTEIVKVTIVDAADAAFSTLYEMEIFDNNSEKVYLEANGSTQTIKVPNSISKTLDEIATLTDVNNVDLQKAYDEGSIINLASLKNITVNDSLSNPVFEIIEDGVNSGVRITNNFVFQRDDTQGPTWILQNGKTGAISDGLASFFSISSASNGDTKSSTFLSYTVTNETTANYGTNLSLSVYDNDIVKKYIEIDGSTESAKAINNATKTLDFIATIDDVIAVSNPTMQEVYDNGNTIQLSLSNDIVISNSSASTIFEVVDNGGSNSKTRTWSLSELRRDGFTGPSLLMTNEASGSVGLLIGSIRTSSKTSTGNQFEVPFIEATETDPLDATFSQGFRLNIFDNNNFLPYLEANGSTRTIKVPNSTSKILDEIATLSDIASAADTLQSVYDNSTPKNIDYSSGNDIQFTLPDTSTPLFLVSQTANGVNQEKIASVSYDGFNQLGASHTYHNDEIFYRLNLSAPANIDSCERRFSVLQNASLVEYLALDGGGREVRLLNDRVTINTNGAVIEQTTSVFPELSFFSNVTGGVNEPVLLISSDSRNDAGALKEVDILKVETTDPINASFSQSINVNAYGLGSIRKVLEYQGSSLQLTAYGNLAVEAILPDAADLVFIRPGNGGTGNALGEIEQHCNSSTGTNKNFTQWVNAISDGADATFSTGNSLVIWDNNVQKIYYDIDGSTKTFKVINNTTKNLDFVATVSDIPKPSYGKIDFQGNATVTPLTLNQVTIPIVPAVGGYTQGAVTSDFVLGASSTTPSVIDALKYTGTNTRTFECTVIFSLRTVAAGTSEGEFYVAKNGAVDTDSRQSMDVYTTPYTVVCKSIQTLSTNDVFQGAMRNITNNDDWIVKDFCLIAKALD